MFEPILLTATRVRTFIGQRVLTNASGFFFERDERLYLVTSRHVLHDEPAKHFPDRVEIELHSDLGNLTQSVALSMPLYQGGKQVWRQGHDTGGNVDIAVIELDRGALSKSVVYRAFTPAHLIHPEHPVEVGTKLLIVGFPMGFHDTLHHVPVVRQAVIASSFSLRFQGLGYFLTDARTHRGTSGSPVVARCADTKTDPVPGDLQWRLLGVHSARLDVGNREVSEDEALGLNCAWYADMLMTLTQD